LAGLVLVQDGAGDVREGVVAGGEGCRGGGPGLLLLRCREGGGGLCGFVSGGGDLVECRRHSQKLAERRAARIGGEVEAIHQPTELRRGGGHGHIEGGEHIRHLGGHSGELFLFGVEKVVVPRGGGGEVLHATHRLCELVRHGHAGDADVIGREAHRRQRVIHRGEVGRGAEQHVGEQLPFALD